MDKILVTLGTALIFYKLRNCIIKAKTLNALSRGGQQ